MGQQNSKQNSLPIYQNKKYFIITLIILQIIIIGLYAGILKIQVHNDQDSIGYNYPSYMDNARLVLVGFGLVGAFIKRYSYSGMIGNWLIYCVAVQICFVFGAFWYRVFGYQLLGRNFPGNDQYLVYARQQDYTLPIYSTAVCIICFGVVFGRVGMFEKLIIIIILIFTYLFNVVILLYKLQIYDVAGSIFANTYGCYFAMGLSAILSRHRPPVSRPQGSYQSVIFAFLGCFLIYVDATSINSQYLTQTPFQKSLVIMNSLLSMSCSVVAAYAMCIFLRKKFSVLYIFNGALSGCIGAGSSLGLFVNPCACMILGVLSGVVCCLGIQYMTGYLQTKWKIHDTFCVHSVRGFPGILGGLAGAVGIALSQTLPQDAKKELYYFSKSTRSVGMMAGYQVIGTFSTVIIGIIFGLLTGLLITRCFKTDPKHYYQDILQFQVPEKQVKQFMALNIKDTINNPQQQEKSFQIADSAENINKKMQNF